MFRGSAVIRPQLFVRMARLPAERIRGIRGRVDDAFTHRR